MDKLEIATQVLLKLIETDKTGFDAEGIAGYAWEIADAMQAEADKREDKTRPDVLDEVKREGEYFFKLFCRQNGIDYSEALREVDWCIAPSWAKYWAIREDGNTALWCVNKPTVTDDCLLSHGGCSPAPSFGFTGTHIVERPNGF